MSRLHPRPLPASSLRVSTSTLLTMFTPRPYPTSTLLTPPTPPLPSPVICGARKPGFLLDPYLPLFRVNTEDATLANIEIGSADGAARALAEGKVFQGGNWNHLHRMLRLRTGSQLMYVGDHMYSGKRGRTQSQASTLATRHTSVPPPPAPRPPHLQVGASTLTSRHPPRRHPPFEAHPRLADCAHRARAAPRGRAARGGWREPR